NVGGQTRWPLPNDVEVSTTWTDAPPGEPGNLRRLGRRVERIGLEDGVAAGAASIVADRAVCGDRPAPALMRRALGYSAAASFSSSPSRWRTASTFPTRRPSVDSTVRVSSPSTSTLSPT